jgi:hypothetical protein
MFIVPFYTRAALPSLIKWSLVPITLFLDNRGKQLCETDEPEQWLADNSFFVKSKWREGKILYVEIDIQSMELKEFYSFEEVTRIQQKGTEECWRTFFILKAGTGEATSSIKQWNDCIDETFVEALETIQKRCMP